MLAFEVNDMTCGHCAGTIAKALNGMDAEAKVFIDLVRHLVTVEAATAPADALANAIREAGYTAVPLPASVSKGDEPVAGKSWCGHCH